MVPPVKPLPKPEVMSPAGYWPQLEAAIQNGAGAVYFGLKHFTARAKAGFAMEELPDAFRQLHQHGVRGYITFNTLVFQHELKEAARAIGRIAESGADALIVQDVGILKLARQIAPDIELHASTQLSVTSVDGIEMARALGATRVTLARELSLDDLRAIRVKTDAELEVFVHGALCVAYSGQCLSSEAWGGRSANRGQCAQACRLPYDLMVDGQFEPLGDARYLLSPGDLFALEQIPELIPIGISALKIEGRYKDAEYVALATRAYRKAVDEAWAGHQLSISAAEKLQLEQAYSRGLAPHFMTGTNHQAVVGGRSPRHRGVAMGRVKAVTSNSVLIEPGDAHRLAPLKAGDGLVFDAADWRSPEEPEEGGRVYSAASKARDLELTFANGAVDFSRIRAGDIVWRTHDPELEKTVRALTPVRQKVRIRVQAHEGQKLHTEWSLENRPATSVTVDSDTPLPAARDRAVSEQYLADQLGRLGGTAYELSAIEWEASGSPFAPASLLNQIRRQAVEKLQARQAVAPSPRVDPVEVPDPPDATLRYAKPQLHLLVRTPQQLEAALKVQPASITLDYLDLYGLRPSVDRVKAARIEARVASPRVLKPGEERILDFLLRLDCPILVRPAGMLHALRDRPHPPLTGDFSLNAANTVSAEALMALGLQRLTPGHDLNAEQIANLARKLGGNVLEVVAYQHLPVFHTEHCVFCRFLSNGTSYRDCGRPCETHSVELRDKTGRMHPVMADVGCRNTVFGAEAQEASAHLGAWLEAGISHFRLEFAHESEAETERVASAFQAVLADDQTSEWLRRELKRAAPQGTTEGSLFVPNGYAVLPVLG